MDNLPFNKSERFHNIRKNLIYKFLETALSGPASQYVISLGSSTGEFETELQDALNIKIYCIDPLYNSLGYNAKNTVYIKDPDYPYIDDFLEEHPSAIENSILLMFWTEPNENDYDVEAIYKLDPSHIISLYDASGVAGSNYYLRWIFDTIDAKPEHFYDPEGNLIYSSSIISENFTEDELEFWKKTGWNLDRYNGPNRMWGNRLLSVYSNLEEREYYDSYELPEYNFIEGFQYNLSNIAYRLILLSLYNKEDFDKKLLEEAFMLGKHDSTEQDREVFIDVESPGF